MIRILACVKGSLVSMFVRTDVLLIIPSATTRNPEALSGNALRATLQTEYVELISVSVAILTHQGGYIYIACKMTVTNGYMICIIRTKFYEKKIEKIFPPHTRP